MNDKIDIGIVIPPISDCFMPTLGAAQIVAFLKDNDISSRLFDLSSEFNYMNLKYCAQIPEAYKTLLEGESQPYRKLVSLYNMLSDLNNCKITTDSFECGVEWKDVDQVKEYIKKKDDTICAIFKKIPSLKELCDVSYIGFSISYDSQILPSIIIAKIIKKLSPKTKIIFGGSFFYNYFEDFFSVFYEINIIDYVIVGRGEEVLKYLLKFGNKFIESCGMFKCKSIGERMYIDTVSDLNSAVVYTPCFDDINFAYYPSEEKAFPYMIRSSCYYGKCNFCNGDKLSRDEIIKDVSLSFENMVKISRKIGVSNVYIVDAAISPSDLVKITELDLKNSVKWIANARFDKKLADRELMKKLHSNGCKMLRFGLESGSQKVLNLMNKGTNIDVVHEILKYAYEAGIQNHVYIMLGYPGETKEDRNETIEFLRIHKKYVKSYSISFFQPMPNTPVYRELKKKLSINKHDDYSAVVDYVYRNDKYYQEIVDDAEKIKTMLSEYSSTNAELYSANIFSDVKYSTKKMIVHSEYIFDKPLPIHVDNNICMEVGGNNSSEEYYIYDMYNNMCIEMHTPLNVKRYLLSGGDDTFEFESNSDDKLLTSVLNFLGRNTRFIENYSPNISIPLHRDILICTLSGEKLRNLSIQFDPKKRMIKE